MAVDQASRAIVADAVASFISGRSDNWELDDAISSVKTDDLMVIEMRRQLWLMYDDVRHYRNEGKYAFPEDIKGILDRWKELLLSDVEWSEIGERAEGGWWSEIYRRFILPRLAPTCKFLVNPY